MSRYSDCSNQWSGIVRIIKLDSRCSAVLYMASLCIYSWRSERGSTCLLKVNSDHLTLYQWSGVAEIVGPPSEVRGHGGHGLALEEIYFQHRRDKASLRRVVTMYIGNSRDGHDRTCSRHHQASLDSLCACARLDGWMARYLRRETLAISQYPLMRQSSHRNITVSFIMHEPII